MYNKIFHFGYQIFVSDMQLKHCLKRNSLKQHQVEILKQFFGNDAYPSAKQKEKLARRTNLNLMQINSWFDRQRGKRKISREAGEKMQHIHLYTNE